MCPYHIVKPSTNLHKNVRFYARLNKNQAHILSLNLVSAIRKNGEFTDRETYLMHAIRINGEFTDGRKRKSPKSLFYNNLGVIFGGA